MTEEQIEGLSDDEAKAKAAEVSGGTWEDAGCHSQSLRVGNWASKDSIILWNGMTREWFIWDVAGAGKKVIYAAGGDRDEAGFGETSRAFLRCYYSGEITLPGRPAWAPVLRRLKAAGFLAADRWNRNPDGVGGDFDGAYDIAEAFRIAMGVE